MSKKISISELKSRISVLENKRTAELRSLKEEFHLACENLRPANLIRNTFKKLGEPPDFKENLVNSAIGLASGFISQKLFVRSSNNPLKKLLGVLLQFAVTNLVIKNPGPIKNLANNIIERTTGKDQQANEEEHTEEEHTFI